MSAVVSSRGPGRRGLSRREADASGAAPLAPIVTARRDRVVMRVSLLALAIGWLFPVYAAVRKSLEVNGFANYVSLFTDPVGGVSVFRSYANSLILGVTHAFLVVSISTMAAYAFTKMKWRGREAAFAAALLFLAVPPAAMIVPFYHITREAGLFNSLLGVGMAETAITLPFAILLMRNFATGVPDAMIEAARVDGAGHWQVFRLIYAPMMRPAIINLIVLCFVWSMQDFLWPSVFIRDSRLVSAAQAVQQLNTGLGAAPADIARYNASLVLLAVPAVLIVTLGSRFIVNGLTGGSVKE